MKKLWIVFFLLIIFAGCTNQQADELILPTQVHTPTRTATPTALVLADHGDQTEPYPELEVITAKNVHRLEEVDVWGQGTVMGIALSPDATTIAVSTTTGIYFYDADSMEQVDWIDFSLTQIDYASVHPFGIYDNLDFSPDGKNLLIGFDDLYIIDFVTKEISQFEMTETDMAHPYIMEVTYSNDGKHILVNRASPGYGSRKMLFEIYETKSANIMFQYDYNWFEEITRICLIDDRYAAIHQILVEVDSGRIIKRGGQLFDDVDEQLLGIEQLEDDEMQVTIPKIGLTCNFNGKNIWRNSSDFFERGNMSDFSKNLLTWIIFNWDTSELNVLHFDSCRTSEQNLHFPENFIAFEISQNGNFIISQNFGQPNNYLWSVDSGKVVITENARQLAIDGFDSQLLGVYHIWNEEQDDCIFFINNILSDETVFRKEDCTNDHLTINPMSSNILLLGDNLIDIYQENSNIKSYRKYSPQFTQDGKYVVYFVKQRERPYAYLYFDPVIDGELGPTKTVAILIPAASYLHYTKVDDFQLSNTGEYVVFYGEDDFLVWNLFVEEPILIYSEKEIGYIENLVFTPDDELLLIKKYPFLGGKITFYDLKTERVVYDLIIPQNLELGPLISPDGKFLAFLAEDQTIRIYGVKREQAGD